jgi:hypothetical protein
MLGEADGATAYWIDGATHVDLYDKDEYVPTAVAKPTGFFGTHLGTSMASSRSEHRAQPTIT